MLHLNQWKAGPALMVVLGMATSAIAPLSASAPVNAAPAPTAIAQLFPSSPSYGSVVIPPGARLPVRYDGGSKIIVAPDETVPLTLIISRNVRSSSGALLIPAGSQVRGKLQPVNNGSQFFADSLLLPNGARLPLDASSNVVTKREEVQPGVNGDALIKGSVIGAGAATLLSGVLGNRRITLGKILAGSGAGALGGLVFGKKKAEVIVIEPNSDLRLTLNSQLALNTNY